MNRTIADTLYNHSWCHPVSNVKQANTRILKASSAGCYTICITASTISKLTGIGAVLKQNGFNVEPYNGSIYILQISWG